MVRALVYPHHLFKNHPAIGLTEHFVLIEDPLFFNEFSFHRQKLVFHRASMKEYQLYLSNLGHKTTYIEQSRLKSSGEIFDLVDGKNFITCDLDDYWLQARLKESAVRSGVELRELNSPGFVSPLSQTVALLGSSSHYFMANFYRKQRQRTGILMEEGEPVGGQWSYDAENRKKLPKSIELPTIPEFSETSLLQKTKQEIAREYSNNPGSLAKFIYPVTFSAAEEWLEVFLEQRFLHYGDFQDAIHKDEGFIFHSLLSPLINSGLLTPLAVLERALAKAQDKKIPLNSLEGFVRQILGWREFVRAVYHKSGRSQRTRNFWSHTRMLPASFWDGSTGILPVDCVIKRTLDSCYSHHIERLMVLGNFMLLCEIHPDQVYRWFMEMFIDAYDWVMVPNVYGMSQYADGGRMTTKPYFSSSNYIKKMSNFQDGPWCEIWDGLFWRFIHIHREFFSGNPRLQMMVSQLNKMDQSKLNSHLRRAEGYLSKME